MEEEKKPKLVKGLIIAGIAIIVFFVFLNPIYMVPAGSKVILIK